MKSLILLCLVGVALSFSIEMNARIGPHRPFFNKNWPIWKSAHNKQYKNVFEENVRYTIWLDNLRQIRKYNQKRTNMILRINHFGDLTNTEFAAQVNGYLRSNNKIGSTIFKPSHVKVPDTVDWRHQGYVTAVKNQGKCGSCWAFSTTGSLEGQHFRKTGKLVSFSEQQLVDCSSAYGNHGCQGGLMDNGFKYIKANGGIDTEDSYPYEAKEGSCRYNKEDKGATDTGFIDITQGNEDALKLAVATVGPVSVAIDASNFSFQFYYSGVYSESGCSSTRLDHGVLVVGYGTEKGKDYWLVKNSWGTSWGFQGYIKMSRNKNNQCGIATSASYPLV